MKGEIWQKRGREGEEGERGEDGGKGRRGKGRGGKGRAPMTLWHGAPQCLNPALGESPATPSVAVAYSSVRSAFRESFGDS